MKVQQITNFKSRNYYSKMMNLKSKDFQINAMQSNSIAKGKQLAFAGSKIDLVKRFIKPTEKDLDIELQKGMGKLNITQKAASKLMPKMQVEVGTYTKILMEKINTTTKRIETLEESLATDAKPATVKEAEEKIDFYNKWDDASEEKLHRGWADSARKRERDKFPWGLKWMSDGDEKYAEEMRPYWNNHYKYEDIKDNLDAIGNTINDYNKSKDAQVETLAALKREKEAYIAELTSSRLGDVVNNTIRQKGGIEERIAGYQDVKEEITRKFVAPLVASKKDDSVRMPSAVVLYGATGVGKTEMLKGIEEQCKDVANVIHFPMDTPTKGFMIKMGNVLKTAKDTYEHTHKRTILLIDEAEKYMCMTQSKAKRFCSDLESDDFDVLTAYGKDDIDNINYLKSLLDNISEIPKDGDLPDDTKSATTLFITTNYPHLIDQDLMKRKGKFTPIAVKPAADSNLKAVIQHYFKQNSDLLETTKAYSRFPNFDNIIDGQIRFSEKAKKVLKEKRSNGTLSNLHVNYELTDWPNMERFLKFTNPSDKKGAYSNVELKGMINTAFDRYLENPTKKMNEYFFDVKGEMKIRDITPKRYSKFKSIYSMVNDKFENEGMNEADKDFTDLINKYQNGQLNDEMSKTVEGRMEKIQDEFNKLEESKKSGVKMTPGEQMQYDTYKIWVDMWE